MMTQADLVRKMAQGAHITQPHAAHALRILLESIQIALRRGECVRLAGLAHLVCGRASPAEGAMFTVPAGLSIYLARIHQG